MAKSPTRKRTRVADGKPRLGSDGKPFTTYSSPNAPKIPTNGSVIRNGVTLPVIRSARPKRKKK